MSTTWYQVYQGSPGAGGSPGAKGAAGARPLSHFDFCRTEEKWAVMLLRNVYYARNPFAQEYFCDQPTCSTGMTNEAT